MSFWLDLPEGEGVSERETKSRQIHHHSDYLGGELPSALLLSLSPLSSYLGLAARSLSSYERLSSRSTGESRTHDGKRKCTADLDHEQHRREMNSTHVRRCLHDGRSPLPMCHRFPRLSEQIDEESGGFLLPLDGT